MQCLSLEGSFVGTNWIFTPSTNYQGQMDFCHTTVQFSEHSLSVTVLCWRRCRWSISKRNTGPMLRSNNKNAERIWVDQVYYAVVQQKLMTWYNFVDNAGFVFIWFWFEKWSNLFFHCWYNFKRNHTYLRNCQFSTDIWRMIHWFQLRTLMTKFSTIFIEFFAWKMTISNTNIVK